MSRSTFAWMTCAGLAAVLAAAGVSGNAAQPPDQATTVDAVTVGIPPPPQVGEGATHFTVEHLQEAQKEAREESIDHRDAVNVCGVSPFQYRGTKSRPADAYVPGSATGYEFLAGLYSTMRDAQNELQNAAEKAEAATSAALEARLQIARGVGAQQEAEATELARQAAVKAFQAALSTAEETRFRILDAETFIQLEMRPPPENPTSPPAPPPAAAVATFVRRMSDERANGAIAGVYVPEQWEDLRLSQVAARQVEMGGIPVLRISGRIHNTRRRAIGVPPLWFTAVDQYRTPLKSETARPQGRNRIPAGGSLPFAYDLKPMPERAASAVVTFAPEHQVAFQLPAGVLCSMGLVEPYYHRSSIVIMPAEAGD